VAERAEEGKVRVGGERAGVEKERAEERAAEGEAMGLVEEGKERVVGERVVVGKETAEGSAVVGKATEEEETAEGSAGEGRAAEGSARAPVCSSRQERLSRNDTIVLIDAALKTFALVMYEFMVLLVHEQCCASMLWPISCATRSNADASLKLKSISEMPTP